MRKVIGTLAVLIAGTMGVGVASAQEAGVDQYAPTTTTPTTTSPANPTTGAPASAVAGVSVQRDAAENRGGKSNDSADGGTGTGASSGGGGSGSVSGAGAASASANRTTPATAPGGVSGEAALPGNRVAFLQFGPASRKLQDDVTTALERAGLQVLFEGDSTRDQLKAFLGSPAAAAINADDPNALGKAFGAQLVNPTPAFLTAFPILFGSDTPYVPVIRAVLTRIDDLTQDEVDFQLGVAEGLRAAGVPVAYVERSNRDPSFLDDYGKLDVPTVENVETDAGKLRLGQIMLRIGEFARTAKVDADRSAAQVSAGSAGGSSGPAVAPLVLLIGLLGVVALWCGNAFLGGRRMRAR